MALSDSDINYILKFYSHEISSKELADFLLSRNLKFKDVESELRNLGVISEIQKCRVDSTQEFLAYLRMGEIVTVGDDMHFFIEDGVAKVYQLSAMTLHEVDGSRVDELYDLAMSLAEEVSVRFGTRMHFNNSKKKKRSEKNEKDIKNDNGNHQS